MSNVIRFPNDEQWLFSVDVWRRPDGLLEARLTDARKSLIEAEPQSSRLKLLNIVEMLSLATANMREAAKEIGDAQDE